MFFPNDNTAAHTVINSMATLYNIFRDWVISCPFLPAGSTDLKSCDDCLWGTLKDNTLHTQCECQEVIRCAISAISKQTHVTNLFTRYQAYLRLEGVISNTCLNMQWSFTDWLLYLTSIICCFLMILCHACGQLDDWATLVWWTDRKGQPTIVVKCRFYYKILLKLDTLHHTMKNRHTILWDVLLCI